MVVMSNKDRSFKKDGRRLVSAVSLVFVAAVVVAAAPACEKIVDTEYVSCSDNPTDPECARFGYPVSASAASVTGASTGVGGASSVSSASHTSSGTGGQGGGGGSSVSSSVSSAMGGSSSAVTTAASTSGGGG